MTKLSEIESIKGKMKKTYHNINKQYKCFQSKGVKMNIISRLIFSIFILSYFATMIFFSYKIETLEQEIKILKHHLINKICYEINI